MENVDPPQARPSLASDALAYWTAQVGNFLLALITSVFVAVALGPEQRGLLVAVILVNTLLVNLTNLGMQTASMYFIGKSPDQLARFHTLAVLVVGAITLIDWLALSIGGGLLRAHIMSQVSTLTGLPWGWFALAAGVLPLSLYFFAAQGVLAGFGRLRLLARWLFYYSVVVNGANLAAIGLYSGDQAGLARLLILIWALGQLGAAIGLAGHIRRLPCRWVKMKAADYLNEAKRFLSYGMRAFVGNFASSLVNRADHLFVIAAAGPAGIGIYNLAAKWAELVFQPSAALESAAYARAASADRNQAAQLVLKLFRANVFLCALGVTVLIVLARPLVLCFYTEEYAEAVGPLRVLLPGALLLAGCRMLAIYFSAHLGKPQIPSAIAWMGALLNVALLSWIVMGRDGGLMGAAIATTSAYGLMFICYWVCFARATGRYGPAEYFLPRAEDWRRLSAAWEDFKRGSG